MYLHCSTDNRASTVLEHFVKATSEFGIPSHVRSDKGSENRLVALHMLSQLGTNRNSMLTGRNVHNQRIERYAVILTVSSCMHACCLRYNRVYIYHYKSAAF